MAASDPTLIVQTGAVIAQIAAGVVVCCGAKRQRRNGLLGTALLVGGLLTAVDSTGASSPGLPLASWALIAFGLLTAITGSTAARIGGNPLHLALLGAIALTALHQAHTMIGGQASWELFPGTGIWQPFDLGYATVLGWLALRGLHDRSARLLVGTHALGLLGAAFLTTQHTTMLAATQVLGALPFLLCAMRRDWPQLAVATASAATFAFLCCIRATTDQAGIRPHFAGMQDPLLLSALLSLVFGAAVLRAYAHRRRALRTASPVGQPTPQLQPIDTANTHDATATTAMTATSQLSTQEVLHDLRQPVTSMLAAAGLLTTTKDPQELASQVETLRTYGQQLATAIDDLEDFERMQNGAIDLAEDTFDLPVLLQESVAEVKPSVADRSIELRLDVDRTLPRWVQGDATRTRQLLVRMLRAICRNASMGPIDISAAADDGVHISMLARGSTLPETTRNLGVAFCCQLARSLGGKLLITTLADAGVELRLHLPKHLAAEWEVDLLDEDAKHSDAADTATAPVLNGKVLLVDDSPDHLLLVGRMLSRAGAQVSTANSGELALHLLVGTPFDLVLLDMQLPGIDGFTTVQRLRERGVTTPVLALTADNTPANVERCLAAGCNGHLGKPVDFGLLRRSLAMHLPIAVQ